jgi:hypothetical protein
MKTVITVLIFSIVSGIGGVFAVTELRHVTAQAGGSSAVIRATVASASPQQNQELQQWVNH